MISKLSLCVQCVYPTMSLFSKNYLSILFISLHSGFVSKRRRVDTNPFAPLFLDQFYDSSKEVFRSVLPKLARSFTLEWQHATCPVGGPLLKWLLGRFRVSLSAGRRRVGYGGPGCLRVGCPSFLTVCLNLQVSHSVVYDFQKILFWLLDFNWLPFLNRLS
jgi:hypothetical protein